MGGKCALRTINQSINQSQNERTSLQVYKVKNKIQLKISQYNINYNSNKKVVIVIKKYDQNNYNCVLLNLAD